MSEPAVGSMVLIGLKYCIDRSAVKNTFIKLSSCQVIISSHITRIIGLIIMVMLLVNKAELFNKRLHDPYVPTNNTTIK